MVKEIQLTQGYVALVDDEDYPELSRFNWCARIGDRRYGKTYAGRRVSRAIIWMHKQIMGVGQEAEVDHINGKALDNQRGNLRIVSHQQNSWNTRKQRNGNNPYKGAYRTPPAASPSVPWRSQIAINGKAIHLGCFSTAEEAARAYDKAARELFGEFACLNFPDERTAQK